MALGVAQGMQALEAAEPPILHRDLKPSNVFIDAAGRPRVADMGLARRLTPSRLGILRSHQDIKPRPCIAGTAALVLWGISSERTDHSTLCIVAFFF